MARNAEKAQSMLNRWVSLKSGISKGVTAGRRPRLSTQCSNVEDCEFWRRQIVKETSRRIQEIQNAGLGEHRLRDLNDQINKLLRERHHWEERIKQLGGPDYKASAPRALDAHGFELTGHGGYKYFGAAKDLPGVRELFEKDAGSRAPKRLRAELYRGITPDYYGWRDEEDATILLAEQAKEAELRADAVEKWRTEHQTAQSSQPSSLHDTLAQVASESLDLDPDLSQPPPSSSAAAADFKAYVAVPTSDEIKELILEKKKQALLEKYATPQLREQTEQAKELAMAAGEGGKGHKRGREEA
ncbi:unnamed protein product [Vitrella brassicaformis CCMP3155]|uniref:Pre-mRNA-splicing factor ISY1 n=2 Tax=Vitrella brassicaformis TaxID=1169539 RepID=A0A0G4GYU9_VITBC|nr:unnamed protein product [Vitrella brassicaformis CCMP3155]|mmetsp:Transcript_14611/g.42109  ORF Transcript_14611/g.42109 Transcript_14611/m.42109 type:complete len:301 (-) Transcript_14611:491-1393(-)|eukprot:CEM36115.1 unnamed protein product [Vitrella brassicaformis CCMP3155]